MDHVARAGVCSRVGDHRHVALPFFSHAPLLIAFTATASQPDSPTPRAPQVRTDTVLTAGCQSDLLKRELRQSHRAAAWSAQAHGQPDPIGHYAAAAAKAAAEAAGATGCAVPGTPGCAPPDDGHVAGARDRATTGLAVNQGTLQPEQLVPLQATAAVQAATPPALQNFATSIEQYCSH